MNLEEIRQVVAFMKENGVCELSYTEKNASVSVKLAPPPPPHGKGPGFAGRPGKEHKGAPEAEKDPFEPDYSGVSVEFYDDGDEEDEDNKELKKAAKAARKAAKAAVKEARAAAREATKAAKAAVKKATDNVNAAAEEADVDAEEVATEAELDAMDAELDAAEAELDAELDAAEAEQDAAEAAEEPAPEAQPEEKGGNTVVVTIDAESLKAGAKEAADKVTDAVVTTAKIGMELGKQGLQFLKDKRDEYLTNNEAAKTPDAPAQQPEEQEAPEAPIEIEITLEDDSDKKDEE
ncbi:MAG: hypothetical protein LUF28_10265 [Clostridiales bacterium]|nr:hypothetical protein [Clostridiales bacterium]